MAQARRQIPGFGLGTLSPIPPLAQVSAPPSSRVDVGGLAPQAPPIGSLGPPDPYAPEWDMQSNEAIPLDVLDAFGPPPPPGMPGTEPIEVPFAMPPGAAPEGAGGKPPPSPLGVLANRSQRAEQEASGRAQTPVTETPEGEESFEDQGRLEPTRAAREAAQEPESAEDLQRQILETEGEIEREAASNNLIAERLRAQELNDQLRARQISEDRARDRARRISEERLDTERNRRDMGFSDFLGALMIGVGQGAGRMQSLMQEKINRELDEQRSSRDLRYQQAVAELGDERQARMALESRYLNAAAGIAERQAKLGTLNAQRDAELATMGQRFRLQAMQLKQQVEAQQLAKEEELQRELRLYGAKKGIDYGYDQRAREAAAASARRAPGAQGIQDEELKAYGIDRKRFDSFAEAQSADQEARAELSALRDLYRDVSDGGQDTPGRLESLGGLGLPGFMKSREGIALDQGVNRALSKLIKARSGATATEEEVARLRSEMFGDFSGPAVERGLDTAISEIEMRERHRNQRDPGSATIWQRSQRRSGGDARGAENLSQYR